MTARVLINLLRSIALAIWLIVPCLAQEDTKPEADQTISNQFEIRTYTNKDGLPENGVQTLAFDKRGYLWIGTQDGAAYYNGNRWTVVNLPQSDISNNIRKIIITDDNSYWFGTAEGILYHLKDGNWTTYNKQSGLPSNSIRSLLETKASDGSSILWVGTGGSGLVKLHQNRLTVYNTDSGLPSNSIRSLMETKANDGSSILWVGTNSNGLAKFEHDSWTVIDTDNGLPNNSIRCTLETIANDGSKILWVGTFGGGLARLHKNQWTVFDTDDGLPNNNIRSLLETRAPDGSKILWVGTFGGGLAKLEKERWTVYNTTNGLPNNNPLSLLESRAASGSSILWVGTFGGGLARLEHKPWTVYDTNSGLPNSNVRSLLESRNPDGSSALWIGTYGGGLAKLSQNRWTIYDTNSGLPDNNIRCLLESKNSQGQPVLWAGTFTKGLAKFEQGRWKTYDTSSGLPFNSIRCLLESRNPDGSSVLWVGTNGGGLAKLSQDKWTSYDIADGLPSKIVSKMLETRDSNGNSTIWVGTKQGLVKLYNDQWTVYTSQDGLPGNSILSLMESKDSNGNPVLWIGTENGGIARLNLNTQSEKFYLLSENTSPALPNNTIHNICQDDKGRIYLSTNKGIARLTTRLPSALDASLYDVYTFTTEEGLPSNQFNGGASLIDQQGRIWMGTVSGLIMSDLSKQKEEPSLKPIYIERIILNGKARSVADLILSFNENNLTFEYALLSLNEESKTRYCTQLIGLDPSTSAWTADYKRDYTNLAEGEYTFQVWGKDYLGNISGPQSIKIKILPALWRTWWAYSLYIILIIATLWGGLRFYEGNLRRRNELLEMKIKERTEQLLLSEQRALASEKQAVEANRAKSIFLANMSHELRTPLNAIIGFSQLIARSNVETDDRQRITTIIRSGEHLLSLINDVLSLSKIEEGKIVLKKQPFNLHRLIFDLKSIFLSRAISKNLQFHCLINSELPQQVLGDEAKLKQVLINLLGNAVKFTAQGDLTLKVTWQNNRGYFVVEDSGVGIDETELKQLFQPFSQTESGLQAKEGVGLGLFISQSLINQMGGKIEVESQPGKGSRFTFEIDLISSLELDPLDQLVRVVGLKDGQPDYRIMVIDDVYENRAFLKTLLSQIGFNLREAASSATGLEIWREWQPHLIFLDMRLKDLDGYQTTEIIRAESANKTDSNEIKPIIIAFTASAFEQDHTRIYQAGCDDILTKPCLEATIFAKIAHHLKVAYKYEADPSAKIITQSVEPVHPVNLSQQLAALPLEQFELLRLAITEGRINAAHQIINEIAPKHERLAIELRRMVQAFQLAELLKLLDQTVV